jgi:ElaA protein
VTAVPVVCRAHARDLDVETLYAILRLRAEVFVVEQAAAYLDLDGRDFEVGCLQLWSPGTAGPVAATARVLVEGGGHRIGRVCTAPAARHRGLAAALVRAALDHVGGGPVIIDAQSYLTDWYERFGFAPTGREFVDDDGIAHTEMVRRWS